MLGLCQRAEKLLDIKVTAILIVSGTLRTVPKGLEKRLEELEIKGTTEAIQTTALLKSTRILRRVMETWRELLLLRLQWKTTSKNLWEKFCHSNSKEELPQYVSTLFGLAKENKEDKILYTKRFRESLAIQ